MRKIVNKNSKYIFLFPKQPSLFLDAGHAKINSVLPSL